MQPTLSAWIGCQRCILHTNADESNSFNFWSKFIGTKAFNSFFRPSELNSTAIKARSTGVCSGLNSSHFGFFKNKDPPSDATFQPFDKAISDPCFFRIERHPQWGHLVE